MNFSLKTLALTAAAFGATAAFAANPARVNVPFSFTANGQSYPAGSYEVSGDGNHTFVTLANQADANKHLSWTVQPTNGAKSMAIVTFDKVGEDYALKSIQLGDKVTPNLNKQKGVSVTTSIGGQ